MAETILKDRLKKYSPITIDEEQDALKEMLQEIILYGLSESDFFDKPVFRGGTSLRIFYNLGRFSEDLDFILHKPDPHFKWQSYFSYIEEICKQYGIQPEVKDKSETSGNVKKMFLKDNSIGKLLNLSFHHHAHQKITIKLEIDTNPPKGSKHEFKFLDFPLACSVAVQDLSSNFAGKSHALLCRQYTKGRDWFDLLWYINKEIIPNFEFLSYALDQTGAWAGQKITVSPAWYLKTLRDKINDMDWEKAVNDVCPFLNNIDKKSLKLWGIPFFMDRLEKLEEIFMQKAVIK